MKYLLVALLVVVALGGASVASAGAPVAAESPTQNGIILQLDALQDIIEQIDQFLEAVVDLLETLQQLFGGGEAD